MCNETGRHFNMHGSRKTLYCALTYGDTLPLCLWCMRALYWLTSIPTFDVGRYRCETSRFLDVVTFRSAWCCLDKFLIINCSYFKFIYLSEDLWLRKWNTRRTLCHLQEASCYGLSFYAKSSMLCFF